MIALPYLKQASFDEWEFSAESDWFRAVSQSLISCFGSDDDDVINKIMKKQMLINFNEKAKSVVNGTSSLVSLRDLSDSTFVHRRAREF